jgi:adenylate cyclase
MTEAPDLYRVEIGRLAATGNQLGGAEVFAILANLELELGLHEQALGTIEGGLGLSAALQQPWCDAWLFTLKAQALRCRARETGKDADAEAEALLRRAADTADQQGARSYALRAATALAAMLHERDRGAEGRALLEAAVDPLDPHQHNAELERARELLSML